MSLGEIITGESIDAYHKSGCIGHSLLETFRDSDRGPARFFGQHIAKTIPREPATSAMDIGNAIDALVLEKRTDFIEHPQIYLGPESTKKDAPLTEKPWNWGANTCKAWGAAQTAKIILHPDEAALVRQMHAAVQANPVSAALLSKGEAQLTFRYNFGPFKVQVRPDWWNREGITLPDGTTLPPYLVDLKSAEDMGQFLKNRRAYGYGRQAALYREVVRMVLADIGGMPIEEVAPPDFLFCVVFKTAPIECVIFRESEAEIAEATNEVIDDLRRLKKCYAENVWPGSPAGISTLPELYRRAALQAVA
jgi:hypothetical protein